MAAKFPNDDKNKGISWVIHPNKLLNKNKNRETEKELLLVKDQDEVVKPKKNKTKKNNSVENTNINPPLESSSDSEMMCLDIFEKLVSKFKSGDTAFVKVIADLCDIYNCENTKNQQFKIDLIEKLLLNLAQADLKELQTLKNVFKEIFIDESLKKMLVDDEDILYFDFKVNELLVGQLKKDGVNRNVYVKADMFVPFINNIRAEATLLSKLNHPNIYNMLAVTRNFSKIAFEIDGYKTYKHLLQDKEITSNLKTVMDTLIKIAETMTYIHSQDILHNYLTSSSIRIKNENVKIDNFLYAAHVDSNGEYIENKGLPCNMYYHISPETAKNRIFTTKTDVWAMGMLCFEVFHYLSSRKLIPLELIMLHILSDFQQGLCTLKRPDKCPAALFLYITEKLLNFDPDKRPNFPEIVTALQDIRRRC